LVEKLLTIMDRPIQIRRSGAYGISGVIVLLGSMFLPPSTPDWYAKVVFCLVCVLAGAALYFNAQERRAGEPKRNTGFFVLAVLVILFAVLIFIPLF
jgi:hypothetical protein